MSYRLETVAPDLVETLEGASEPVLRSVAHRAALLAVERTDLDDPRLERARAALGQGRTGASQERVGLQTLVEELDQAQWDLQDAVDHGTATREQQLAAFSRARAASSLWFALDEDALVAAVEALYEANAAIDDIESLRMTVG
jgi:hypothetical protein